MPQSFLYTKLDPVRSASASSSMFERYVPKQTGKALRSVILQPKYEQPSVSDAFSTRVVGIADNGDGTDKITFWVSVNSPSDQSSSPIPVIRWDYDLNIDVLLIYDNQEVLPDPKTKPTSNPKARS